MGSCNAMIGEPEGAGELADLLNLSRAQRFIEVRACGGGDFITEVPRTVYTMPI